MRSAWPPVGVPVDPDTKKRGVRPRFSLVKTVVCYSLNAWMAALLPFSSARTFLDE